MTLACHGPSLSEAVITKTLPGTRVGGGGGVTARKDGDGRLPWHRLTVRHVASVEAELPCGSLSVEQRLISLRISPVLWENRNEPQAELDLRSNLILATRVNPQRPQRRGESLFMTNINN